MQAKSRHKGLGAVALGSTDHLGKWRNIALFSARTWALVYWGVALIQAVRDPYYHPASHLEGCTRRDSGVKKICSLSLVVFRFHFIVCVNKT